MFCRGNVRTLAPVLAVKGRFCRAISVLVPPLKPLGNFEIGPFLFTSPLWDASRSRLRCKMERAPLSASAVTSRLLWELFATPVNDLTPRRFAGSIW